MELYSLCCTVMRPVLMGGFRKNNNMCTENFTGRNLKIKRFINTKQGNILKQYKNPTLKQKQVPGLSAILNYVFE